MIHSRYKYCTLLLALLFAGLNLGAAVAIDEYGWTIVTPSADSRVIYVSSSEGNDANDGLSPAAPKATIAHAQGFIRDGYPDHLLLKRGDTFSISSPGLGSWRNGRSAQEPVVISYYGNEGARPVIETTSTFVHHLGAVRNYQSFIGLDIYMPISDPDSPKFTNTSSETFFTFLGGGDDILLEDCRLRFGGVTVQSSGLGRYRNFQFRRNIVSRNWAHNSSTTNVRPSGIYMTEVHGYVLEENFFDHCGWNETISDAGANMYAHSVYIQYDNQAGGVFRGNISARPAAHGAQLRSGGIAERNLVVLAPIGMNLGGVNYPTDPAAYTYPNRFSQNVILNGRRMHPVESAWPRTPAVWGFLVSFLTDVDVHDNIIANRRDEGSVQAFAQTGMIKRDNIVYKWRASEDMTDPSWPNPDVSLGDYFDSLEETGLQGEAATLAYLEWLHERPISTMPWEMTAYAAISHIRAGFNKGPVGGYYAYEASAPVPVLNVDIAGEPLDMIGGQLEQLFAAVSPASAQNHGLIWESSNPLVASVDYLGVVRAIDQGTTTITVTTVEGGFTDTIEVNVTVDPATDVEIITSQLGLRAGDEFSLQAVVSPSTAVQSVSWMSSNGDIVEIDSEGTVKAIAHGEATLTATNLTGLSDSIVVTVSDPALMPENLAPGSTISVTGQSSSQVGANLINGNTSSSNSSRWSASPWPQSATIDLGDSFYLMEFWVYPQDHRDYQYSVEVSSDGAQWTQVVDRSQNAQGSEAIIDRIVPIQAQHVRLTVTGSASYTGGWVSLGEFEIYGQEEDPDEDTTWYGYEVVDEWTYVNFLGWIYVGYDPWIYSSATDTWLYLEGVSGDGAWSYAGEGWGSTWNDSYPWVFSYNLDTWIYVFGEASIPSGWGYIMNPDL